MRFIIGFVLALLSLYGHGQIDTSGVIEIPWAKRMLYQHQEIQPARLNQFLEIEIRSLNWNWEELGPNIQPKELNPGGKAIPGYAIGRGNGTGRINYLCLHPKFSDVIYACSPTGGIWYSLDNGQNWNIGGTDQLPVSGVSSVAVHPGKKGEWVIATGDGDDLFMYSDGVHYTKDFGKTYTTINGYGKDLNVILNGPYYDFIVCEVASHPRSLKRLFLATNKGLWKNNGTLKSSKIVWEKIADGYFYDIELIRGKNKRKDILVAGGDRFYLSFNGGETWEEMPMPASDQPQRYKFVRLSIETSASTPEKVYAAVTCSEAVSQTSHGEATLQVFDIATRSWTKIKSLKDNMNNVIPQRGRAFGVSPINANDMMCGNVQPLYRSEDGGQSFTKVDKNQMHDDCHFIGYGKDGKTVWVAHDGGVSVSWDGGLHYENRDRGIGAANVFGVSSAQTAEPIIAFGGYDTGGNMLRSGQWYHTNWGDGFETITSPFNEKVQFTTMQNGGIYRSDDGLSFDKVVSPSGSKTEWHTWIRMHATRSQTIFCAGAKLMRSNNLGDSWEVLFNAPDLDSSLFNAYRMYVSEDHPSVMYVYLLDKQLINPQIWRTFNLNEPDPKSIIWEKVSTVPFQGWIMEIAIDQIDPKQCWILTNRVEADQKLWHFDGSMYTDASLNLGYGKFESMVLQRGTGKRLYVGGQRGVYTKGESDTTWILLDGLPGTYIKSLDINYTANKLVVGTFGRGVWWGDLFYR